MRAVYSYLSVAIEETGVAARGVYGYPSIAVEERGVQARGLYGYPSIAVEVYDVLARGVYSFLQVTFRVSPDTPPEWHLFDGFTMLGTLRDVEGR